MRQRLVALVFYLFSIFPAALSAQSPVVVELFTSQGCSSCPPADALMHELAARDDVIALALHVDYWDYIGWKDTFAHPAHSERQRAYASAANRRSYYTPQMIVGGTTEIMGYKPMALAKAISEHAAKPSEVSLTIQKQGARVRVLAETTDSQGSYVVHILRYTPKRTVEIRKGENRGRVFEYANIVEDLNVLARWDGSAPMDVTTEAPGDNPIVVIIQDAPAGSIRAASVLR